MSKPFTDEQNNWLIDNYFKYSSYGDLTDAFNKQFNTNYTWTRNDYSPIERRCRRMGLKRYSTNYGFTKEEDAWLEEYAPRFSNKWLSQNISSVCNRSHSEDAIKYHIRENLNIHKGNGGVREDTVQTYKKPLGSLCSWGKRRTRIKLYDTGDDSKDWYPYGRYIYEQHYGVKLPSNYQVIFLDGDYTNFEIKNLYAVNHSEHAILTANGWHSSGQITRTGAMWAKLAILTKES